MRLFLSVKLFECIEQCKVMFRYYRSWKFTLLDITFLSLYFWSNPYRIARKYYQKKGAKNIHCYGETPLTTLSTIADALQLKPSDVILELGCGRARSCFWLSYFTNCHVIGVEQIQRFTIPAEYLRRWFQIPNLTVVCDDYLHLDFSDISVIYLYGSDLSDDRIERLIEKMNSMRKHSRVLSISYPLESEIFQVEKTFPVRFNWGETTAYMQRKIL